MSKKFLQTVERAGKAGRKAALRWLARISHQQKAREKFRFEAMVFMLTAVWVSGFGCKPGSQAGGMAGERVVQVVLAEAKRQDVVESLSLVGSLVANEQVQILSEVEGKVATIGFEEGEKVEEGDLLVELDETKLQASLAEAEANHQLSKANFERAQSLFNDRLISKQDYDQVASAYQANEATLALRRRQLKDTRILSPFDGTVGARNVSPGQVISRNTTLTWLVDLDPVKVEVEVPERFLGQLRVGQKIAILVAAFPGETFTGEVFFVAPFVDPDLRTALVKARVPNPDGRLLPGMFANLELTLKVRDQSVVVPEESLSKLLEDNRATLFVQDKEGRAATREVELGLRLPGQVEILGGLQAGEKVVVQGIQKLAPGVKMRVGNDVTATGPQTGTSGEEPAEEEQGGRE